MIDNEKDLNKRVNELYKRGLPTGYSTGWKSLDSLYTVAPGQWTLVTGFPGHGKSEFVDALMVNLTRHGWKFVVWSAENLPQEIHLAKLMEKYAMKPFSEGPSDRMNTDEKDLSLAVVNNNFKFVLASDQINVKAIITAASNTMDNSNHTGPWGLVIDPWNELEHNRPANKTETEYISESLSKIRAWAREWNVHVWIVAHPAKMQRDKDGKAPKPGPNDVAGSHHWWAKCDNSITVWRDVSASHNLVEVLVHKVRFKHIGKTGLVELRYSRKTGTYSTVESVVSMGDYKHAKDPD